MFRLRKMIKTFSFFIDLIGIFNYNLNIRGSGVLWNILVKQ